MENCAFCNADGDFLIVPQSGSELLLVVTFIENYERSGLQSEYFYSENLVSFRFIARTSCAICKADSL